GDVARGVVVRMQIHATPLAGELRLTLAVRLLTMSTLATGPAGIPGVYQEEGNTCPSRLIGDVGTELKEGPRVPLVTVCASNRCPLSNPRQVFEGECLARDDGFLDQSLADAVVGVFLEPSFLASHPAQALPGASGTARLQPLAVGMAAGT